MKNYRPHILVAIVLAVVLLSGWNTGLRNALADLRFAWKSRPGQRRHRRRCDRRAVDRKNRRVALAAPLACGIAAPARKRRDQRRRARRRFLHAVRSRIGSGVRRSIARRRRIGGAGRLQATRQQRLQPTTIVRSNNSAITPGRRSSTSRSNRTGWSGAIRSASGSIASSCLRWAPCWPGNSTTSVRSS